MVVNGGGVPLPGGPSFIFPPFLPLRGLWHCRAIMGRCQYSDADGTRCESDHCRVPLNGKWPPVRQNCGQPGHAPPGSHTFVKAKEMGEAAFLEQSAHSSILPHMEPHPHGTSTTCCPMSCAPSVAFLRCPSRPRASQPSLPPWCASIALTLHMSPFSPTLGAPSTGAISSALLPWGPCHTSHVLTRTPLMSSHEQHGQTDEPHVQDLPQGALRRAASALNSRA